MIREVPNPVSIQGWNSSKSRYNRKPYTVSIIPIHKGLYVAILCTDPKSLNLELGGLNTREDTKFLKKPL